MTRETDARRTTIVQKERRGGGRRITKEREDGNSEGNQH